MNDLTVRRLAGLLLIVVPIIFTIGFTLLQMEFEYPDILRQPTADVLQKFAAGGPRLIAIWYVLPLSALLFIPTAIFTHQAVAGSQRSAYLLTGTVFGVVAGVVQALGLIRWPLLVPHLAEVYLSPAASDAQRETAALVFEAFHLYAGVAVGENLGYLLTALWTLFIAVAFVRSRLVRPWIGLVGMALAAGIGVGVLEAAGWEAAGTINAISYLVWSLWLIVIGALLLVQRQVGKERTA